MKSERDPGGAIQFAIKKLKMFSPRKLFSFIRACFILRRLWRKLYNRFVLGWGLDQNGFPITQMCNRIQFGEDSPSIRGLVYFVLIAFTKK